MRRSVQIQAIGILVLLVTSFFVSYAMLREERGGILTVSFLDVGQGDSIFIDAPSGRQVLIDGGPDTSVLRELSKVIPWYDRSIDVMIPTHPDADHVSGLVDVLSRYRVSYIIHSDVEGDTATAEALMRSITTEGGQRIVAQRGQIINLGRGAYLEVLFPDRSVAHVDTNTGCVVARLVYGATAFMFSCDAPQSIEKYLVRLDGKALHSDVLKAGHHGSKTSSSAVFVGFVDPAYAVYSRGCDNSYGHPNKETIDTFARFAVPTFDTCEDGMVTFVSDGKTVVRK